MPCLLLTIRFHDQRYHGFNSAGRAEWPPSPARLFQALIAGVARGANLDENDGKALEWLERLDAPIIAAPAMRRGQLFSHFMPDNNLDAVGGDPNRIGEIRTATKRFHPAIFDSDTPFLYVWSFADEKEDQEAANQICRMAKQLYQLGRGVDMAWAVGEILDVNAVADWLSAHPGVTYRPAMKGDGNELACPSPGLLKSLIERHEKGHNRFKMLRVPAPTKKDPSRMKVGGHVFVKLPRLHFHKVSYDSPPTRLLYEIRDMTPSAGFIRWPLEAVTRLVVTLRDDAANKLKDALPNQSEVIECVFGLCCDATEADKARRIRIIPLPSIGHPHADHAIRRLLVEIPSNCPLAANDIAWAFSSFLKVDAATGEIQWMPVVATDCSMLKHYGIGDEKQGSFRVWRSVTPIALPQRVVRRRIDPRHRVEQAKPGSERMAEEQRACTAVAQALRHTGIRARIDAIRIQREPFNGHGMRVEAFAERTRFSRERLWHVEITFAQPVTGPLLIGDGRYLGLGLMMPVKRVEGVHAFAILDGFSPGADPQKVARALRRAVMTLVQDEIGKRKALPAFFTGHEMDGSPVRRGGRSHLAFVFDKPRQRLVILAPHLLEARKPSTEEHKHLRLLDAALEKLHDLRADPAGRSRLAPVSIDTADDPLFARAKTWITQTDYRLTRYFKNKTPEQAILTDVELELRRRGLPVPEQIDQVKVIRGPKGGLHAQLRLKFLKSISGPVLLGQSCNFGGGLFVSAE